MRGRIKYNYCNKLPVESREEQSPKSTYRYMKDRRTMDPRRRTSNSTFFSFRFGPGPHYVKITVEMEFLEPSIQHFTIQLAPLESMPHAVKLFLEQVIHGLWDNGWFYINGPHVMQAGPMVPDDNDFEEQYHDERSAALHLFRELQLDTLAFPEYSEDYPHQPYTLGFTGRPGRLLDWLCRTFVIRGFSSSCLTHLSPVSSFHRDLRRPGLLHQQGRQYGCSRPWRPIPPRVGRIRRCLFRSRGRWF